jgi:hypothetical protein
MVTGDLVQRIPVQENYNRAPLIALSRPNAPSRAPSVIPTFNLSACKWGRQHAKKTGTLAGARQYCMQPAEAGLVY